MCIEEGYDLFVEGRRGDRTVAASIQLDEHGTVRRSWAPECMRVDPPPAWQAGERPPLEPLLERYFAALNGGQFDEAAECFTEDCLYAHPPYRPGEPQVEFRGRTELAAQWPVRRGNRSVETRIERCVQCGNHAFAEGVAGGGSFLSSIVLDLHGLISRYVAFFSPTPVPRVPDAGQRVVISKSCEP
jgi:hypothetical protein